MKLFDWFKKIFCKSINVNDIDDSALIAMVKNNAVIKIGTTLDVKPNFVAVIVAKGKVCDTFVEGKYRLDTREMPLATRVLRLSRTNKKGYLPNKFRADVYFVNLKNFENAKFDSTDFVTTTGKKFKKVKVGLSGIFSYQITSPVEFLEAMLTQYGIVREKIAEDEISSWVSKVVVRKVQKNKPQIEELYERNSKCFEDVVEYANKELSDCGVKILKVDINDTKFPKKIYKNVTLSYDELHAKPVKQTVAELDVGTNPVRMAQETMFQNKSDEVYLEQKKQIEDETNSKTLVANGDGTTELNSSEVSTPAESLGSESISNSDVYQNTSLQSGEITVEDVGEQVEEPIQKVVQYKKCAKCGAMNPIHSDTCFACKTKF